MGKMHRIQVKEMKAQNLRQQVRAALYSLVKMLPS
jgi:hypothetical protein